MSQRNVEILIGRLLTDEDLRRRFIRDARGTLVVHFEEGKVSRLSLVNRAVEMAMIETKETPEGTLIASRR